MTGYGQADIKDKSVSLTVSFKTVNGRFLDLKTHIPREYAAFESELKKKISQTLLRGTVDIYILRKSIDETQKYELVVKDSMAKMWVQEYKKLAKKFEKDSLVDTEVDLQDIVIDQRLISFQEKQQVSAKEKKLLMQAVEKALKACEKERQREGLSLKKDISGKLKQLASLSVKMKKLREQANAGLRKKLENKWKNLDVPQEIDEARLAQEVIIQVDKSDISEELTRLAEHISHMQKLLGKTGLLGKKLDFYTQELLREVNTVGSKCSLASLTELVVDAKALVEQIREQVQNIQ